MIDQGTWDKFQAASEKSRSFGLALIECLDSTHLLLTARRRHNLEISTLENLLRRLDRQSANKIMAHYYGRTDGTPAEMFTAMQLWLEAVCRNQANETLEDL